MEKEKVDYIIGDYLHLLPFKETSKLKYPYLNALERREKEEELAVLIVKDFSDKVFWNNCPSCNKLARTLRARQCRFCGFDWH